MGEREREKQFGWIETLFLCADSSLWGVGGRGGEEVSVADRIFVPVCAGDQTAERNSIGGGGTSVVMGHCRGISLASESEWAEREHQYFVR